MPASIVIATIVRASGGGAAAAAASIGVTTATAVFASIGAATATAAASIGAVATTAAFASIGAVPTTVAPASFVAFGAVATCAPVPASIAATFGFAVVPVRPSSAIFDSPYHAPSPTPPVTRKPTTIHGQRLDDFDADLDVPPASFTERTCAVAYTPSTRGFCAASSASEPIVPGAWPDA